MGDLPLRTPGHRGHGGPLPRRLANVPHAHPSPDPKALSRKLHAELTEYAVLVAVSHGYSPAKGRLHTCDSPVRRSPAAYCYAPLPLDLHVLSLSLAFILSQDQTLRCCIFLCLFPFILQRLKPLRPLPARRRRRSAIGSGSAPGLKCLTGACRFIRLGPKAFRRRQSPYPCLVLLALSTFAQHFNDLGFPLFPFA